MSDQTLSFSVVDGVLQAGERPATQEEAQAVARALLPLIRATSAHLPDTEKKKPWRLTAQEMARGVEQNADDLPLFAGDAA